MTITVLDDDDHPPIVPPLSEFTVSRSATAGTSIGMSCVGESFRVRDRDREARARFLERGTQIERERQGLQ